MISVTAGILFGLMTAAKSANASPMSHDYDLYVWVWQGVDHLEAWDDLQAVFAGFTQKAKQIQPRVSISQAMDTVLDYIEENRYTSSPETLNYQEGLGNILEYRRGGVAE